jgi:hypothetical protein
MGMTLQHELGIPSDPGLVEALGQLAIAHTQLELMLKYTVKTLSGLKIADALHATSQDRFPELRERIKQLFKEKKPTAHEKCQLDALLHKGKPLMNRRNTYLHSAWAQTPSGKTLIKSEDDHSWGPAPTRDDVQGVTVAILTLATELNEARLHGFIAEVIARARQSHSVPVLPR